MAWIALFFAGLLEIVWAFAMKQSHGFSRLVPSLITLGAMVASFGLLSLAMRSLPLGTAYMIWTGIGALGAFAVGAAFLGGAVSPMRLVAAGLILTGLVMMKLTAQS
ncbi:DMT family transporter [Sphingomonas sp. VDB2]|uniref:DMT family transporter n=1 Tax=Sphingomonas sp. VDB2 TaxID=3228751 RepID=UPI003A7F72D3